MLRHVGGDFRYWVNSMGGKWMGDRDGRPSIFRIIYIMETRNALSLKYYRPIMNFSTTTSLPVVKR